MLSCLQVSQAWGVPHMASASILIKCGPAYAMVAEGEVWGCAGVNELAPHRAEAWALIHENIGLRFFEFHRSVLKFLNECEYQRVELVTEEGFRNGERWAKMLGFKREGRMEKYFPNGLTGNLHARVK